jgi:CRP/FNR family cyclic AMP-dependent transcriptional regulator
MSITVAAEIAGHGLFAGVSDSIAGVLAALSSQREAKIGEVLFRVGDAAERFFIVRRGLVSIELYAPGRVPIVVEQVDDGDVIGWSWLVPPYRWRFDARVAEPTSLFSIDAAALREQLDEDPALGYAVTKRFLPVMARRLSSARERLVESITEPA